jgi:iron complex outermembrane receptor protein
MRFPSLTERFFTGSTGAGSAIANADLDPERSWSVDLGARYFGGHLFLELFAFRNEIDDYIEQVEIAPGVTGFTNLTEGTLRGLEGRGSYTFGEDLALSWSGTHVEGESDTGAALAEVPAHRAALDARWTDGRWTAAAHLEHRFAKNDLGPGEQPTEAADILSASLGCRFERGISVRLYGTNLIDETYLPSADELAVPAPGRSVGLSLRWAAK